MRLRASVVLLFLFGNVPARAHDIPNARVDRAIQATVRPGRLLVDYEVGLSELTLTQDLRRLIGTLPDGDRRDWFARYGQETGPLNAKGFLVTVDGKPIDLRFEGYDLAVEAHPLYLFHFEAVIPARGRLRIQDTNFEASEGTSRLAVRSQGDVAIEGDDAPSDVSQIAARPVWQLSDAEERRTKQVDVVYLPTKVEAPRDRMASPVNPSAGSPPESDRKRLSTLLDRAPGMSLGALLLLSALLGAAHAVQPGHGKTLITTTVASENGKWTRGALMALAATLTHTGSVLLVAAGLWISRSTRYGAIDAAIAQSAGFLIAAIGLWRLGRHLGRFGEHDDSAGETASFGARGVIGLGVAAGLVPCWDAVGLIVIAEALGRLPLGIVLLLVFGLGMGGVLVALAFLTARFRGLLRDRTGQATWERRVGIAGSTLLSAIGLYLLWWR